MASATSSVTGECLRVALEQLNNGVIEDELPKTLHEKCLTQIRRKTPHCSRFSGIDGSKIKIPQYIVLEAVFEYILNLKKKSSENRPVKDVADIDIQTEIKLYDNVETQTFVERVDSQGFSFSFYSFYPSKRPPASDGVKKLFPHFFWFQP